MTDVRRLSSRHFFVPQVSSSSELDSGLVALQALLGGYDLPVSIERLRQAGRSADTTSMDALARLAREFGLDAESIRLPADHLLPDETGALPALVITRAPEQGVKVLVIWRRVGNWVQVLDLTKGRRWVDSRELPDQLSVEAHPVAAAQWREHAGTSLFLNPLRARLRGLRVKAEDADKWIARASDDPGWYALAQLAASVRMTASLVRAGAIKRGAEAARVVERATGDRRRRTKDEGRRTDEDEQPSGASPEERRVIRPPSLNVPAQYWSVEPIASEDSGEPERLMQRGIEIVRVRGRRPEVELGAESPLVHVSASEKPGFSQAKRKKPGFSDTSERARDLKDATAHPLRQLVALLRADGLLTPTLLTGALVLATLGVMIQALLFQGILEITGLLNDPNQQLFLLGAILIFMIALFAVQVPINVVVLRLGRRLEMRLRVRFLEKIPRLGDHFFQGHYKSDLVQRAHSLRQLHLLPELGVNLLRLSFQLILTTLGIIWLEPQSALLALAATGAFLTLAYVTQPVLQERDFRLRSRIGALSRFYLDAMLGLVPLKMHGAQRAYRREYEGLVHDWSRASWELTRFSNLLQVVGVFVYSLFAVWLVFDYVSRNGATTGTLLLFFWILALPGLATALVQAIQTYPMLRSLTLRVLEPLNAPDESSPLVGWSDSPSVNDQPTTRPSDQPTLGVAIQFQKVSVQLGGNTILREIDFAVRPGEQVAIVGPSGAGKTTLVGLLLGWHAPSVGECRVDGEMVGGAYLQKLRRELVWVDPAVQLWNQTLWENILYGNAPRTVASTSRAIQEADLLGVVEQLDAGLETSLGEGGGLVSGGEGQRVRLARAMTRAGVRLVILDEPFRGLDRETRRKLLTRAREFWGEATLLCVTHDVNETRAFERVIVMEQGQIVEDAPPAQLAANSSSRYRALLDSEETVRRGLWSSAEWRRLWIQDGVLREEGMTPREGNVARENASL